MNFGEKIKQKRKEKNLTQAELATLFGVTRRVISSYENNASRPRSIESFRRLADILDVKTDYLLREEGSDVHKIIEEVEVLFSGGEITENDMDELMFSIQAAYVAAKKKQRKKKVT